MKLGFLLGAALLVSPAVALANNTANTNTPNTNTKTANTKSSDTNIGQNTQDMQNSQGSQDLAKNDQDTAVKKILPTDAKLIGAVESTDVRAFPDQVGTKGQAASNVQKEDLVGVGAIDRMWTTRQPYKSAVKTLDTRLKGEGIEPIAKTTTQSSTAWNVRMPDGHIANVVVRNTQPTTIESVSASAVIGSMKEKMQPGQTGNQMNQPSNPSRSPSQNLNQNQLPPSK